MLKLPPYVKLKMIFTADQMQYLDWLLYQPLDGQLKDSMPHAHAEKMKTFYKSLKVVVQDEMK